MVMVSSTKSCEVRSPVSERTMSFGMTQFDISAAMKAMLLSLLPPAPALDLAPDLLGRTKKITIRSMSRSRKERSSCAH
jgi:hypothetical protein